MLASLLKQRSSITVYCKPTKENIFHFQFPFAANKRKFAVSVCPLQQTNGSCCFPLVLFSLVPFSVYIYLYRKTELYIYIHRWALLLNSNHWLPFIVCRLRKTNFRFPFLFAANKQKFLNGSCRFLLVPFFSLRNSGNMETRTWRHRDIETLRHGNEDMETWRYRHGAMDMETLSCRHGMETWTWNQGKAEMEAQATFLNPFAHRSNGSLSYVRKPTEVVRLQTD